MLCVTSTGNKNSPMDRTCPSRAALVCCVSGKDERGRMREEGWEMKDERAGCWRQRTLVDVNYLPPQFRIDARH
jgi:hypothetical protein